ncbi:MAG: hypothetical protein AB1746_11350 [Candidatus Zixiibacteriota bacterium]
MVQKDSNAGKKPFFTFAQKIVISAAGTIIAAFLLKGLYSLFDIIPKDTFTTPMQIRHFEFIISVIHVLVIATFLIISRTDIGKPSSKYSFDKEIAKYAFEQFTRGWRYIWWAWLLLYLWLSLYFGQKYVNISIIDFRLFKAIADTLNTLSAIAFYNIFLVLDVPSVPINHKKNRAEAYYQGLKIATIIGLTVVVISIFDHYFNLENAFAGPLLVSFYAAISMAYFFGRLDSHILDIRRWMLAPLYVYVVIQVVWFTFWGTHQPRLEFIFLIIALILKIYLFLVVTNWLQNGKIQKYLDSATDDNIEPPTRARSGLD